MIPAAGRAALLRRRGVPLQKNILSSVAETAAQQCRPTKLSCKPLFFAALLLAAVTARAQPEQWLTYHTSSEGRAYTVLELTTNPPPGVALPALDRANGTPYFARWKTPMDPTGGRWLCLDRSRKSGPYDRLFIDATGSGRLDDQTPVKARLDSYFAWFPPVPMQFKTEDGPLTYHLILRFYQYETNRPQLLASSGGWYEGDVDFAGVKKHVQLVDGNVNAVFNDMNDDAYSSDQVEIGVGDKTERRFLGKLLEVDGKLYRVEVARDGSSIKVQKAENVVFGPVRVPDNIAEFSAFGPNGHFIRLPEQGAFTLPVGQYRMFEWKLKRKDDKNLPWTMRGYNFPPAATFTVAAGGAPAALKIGEPATAELAAVNTGDRELRFELKFVGQQKEAIEILQNDQRPRGPRLTLANADGSLTYTNTFEFG